MKKEIQQLIAANIHHFDLCALLKLLRSYGIGREEVYFLGNTNQSSYSSLCHEIAFADTPPKVTITLNMGLLSSGFAIPSYIHQMIDSRDIQSDKFVRFINFFNHHLVDKFVLMAIPELNEDFFPNWKQTQLHYLSQLGFESISTLWFLIALVFPDLKVDVKKNPQILKIHTSSLILGRDTLGPNSFLGNRFKQTLSSFKITLSTDDERSETGTPWPLEINKRLIDFLFPILKKTDLHLSIVLHVKNKANYLTLDRKSYLGFDRMGKSSHSFQLVIFYGLIRDLKRNRFLSSH